MRDALLSLAERIRKDQTDLRKKARETREGKPGLVVKASVNEITESVCAVDGGLLAYRLHGHDVVASRSVAVNFTYENSVLKSFSHYPSTTPVPDMAVKSALDEHEANVFRSLTRLKSELSCALDAIEKYSPGAMLIDGSLCTVPSDRPGKDSELAPMYQEVVSLYDRLYGQKTLLCGVIKDSRSRKLADSLGFNCSDTVLCSHMLDKGERTASLQYSEEKKELKAFYIKPSEHDLPLRVEYLGDDDEVASLILSLSSISDSFAYPAILIEADMRAAMDRTEAERLQADISSLNMQPLRRNSRPFR